MTASTRRTGARVVGERLAEKEALVAVVRPRGQAMFHTQDCGHAKRAISGLYVLPEDFAPGDVRCSTCRPDLSTPPATTDGGA